MKFQIICLLLLVDCLVTWRHINGADQFQDAANNVEENVDNTCSSIDDKCVKQDRNSDGENKHTYSDMEGQEEHLVFRDDANDVATKDIDIEHGHIKDIKDITLEQGGHEHIKYNDIEQGGHEVIEDIHSEQGGKEDIKDTTGPGGAEMEYYWPPLTRIDPGNNIPVVIILKTMTYTRKMTINYPYTLGNEVQCSLNRLIFNIVGFDV